MSEVVKNREKAPTIRDVAKLAGVGLGTAATVVNKTLSQKRVSETTRQRILDAAKELRYTPNAMAQSLNGVRLKSLGISFQTISHDLITTDHYSLSVLRGIINASYASGYNATLFHRPWHGAEESAAGFRSQGIDGFLLVAPLGGSDMVSGLSALGIPLVVISTSSEIHNVPSVDVDNFRAVRLVLDHLLGMGHQRIAHIYLDGALKSFDSSTRLMSFVKILANAGITPPADYFQPISGDYAPATYEATRALLSLPEPPTAIFTTNDWLARHVIEAAHDMGIRVPEELSVVGFDDIPMAAMPRGITTIRQPLVEMAAEATHMLISLIEGDVVVPETKWFEPELLVRGSTMPLVL